MNYRYLGATLLLCGTAWAQTVVLEPSQIVLEEPDKPITINLQTGTSPVTAEDIRAVRILVDGEEYLTDTNVRYEIQDSALVLNPLPDLPPGRYTLQIDTPSGPSDVVVYRPAPDRAVTLESQARIMEIDELALRQELGMELEVPAARTELNLSPLYYQGQTVVANMNIDPTHFYSWKVNGKEIKYGQGDHTFVYTFKQPGPHVVSYQERTGDALFAAGIQSVDVVARPILVRQYTIAKAVQLEGPDGYSTYIWKVNGTPVGTGKTFNHTFTEAGNYNVEVIAENPLESPGDEFRTVTYSFDVTAQ